MVFLVCRAAIPSSAQAVTVDFSAAPPKRSYSKDGLVRGGGGGGGVGCGGVGWIICGQDECVCVLGWWLWG